jgi:predicted O-methyltransferase YrrM
MSSDSSKPQSSGDDQQSSANPFLLAWEPGHFYSPLPSIQNIQAREDKIFAVPRTIPGVSLNEDSQVRLLNELTRYYSDQPFQEQKSRTRRYYFDNPNFRHGEAVFLYCMIRHFKPKRIVEIGSGYSSCGMLDVNEIFFDDSITCSFIEPYPQLLQSLIRPEDHARVQIITQGVQDVDIEVFSNLSEGDMLFVDSSHVCKIDSDVNHILFNILPRLKVGVVVHIHDIYYPFEYPKEWVYQGRAWTEAYLIRAFLQYNNAFRIELFNSFLGHFYRGMLAENMPLCAKNPGSSLWIKRVAP